MAFPPLHGPPAWVRVDGQNRVYIFTAQGASSELIRYNSDGSRTVLVRDHPTGFYWSGVSLPRLVPGMAVARDGTVYIGTTAYLSNTASTVLKIGPGDQRQLAPMEERIFPSALAIGNDGDLYVATPDVIKKVLSDGTMVTVHNRDRLGFWGEHGFESQPLFRPEIKELAFDRGGRLLAVDTSIRQIELTCSVSPGPAVTGLAESATGNLNLKITPGQLISIYGFRLGPESPVSALPNAAGHYPTEIDGTQVLIDGISSPLLYAGAKQVNAVVPFSVDGRTSVSLEVVRNGRRSDLFSRSLGRIGPAIFSYAGSEFIPDLYARMLNEDGSINGLGRPAKLGSVVTVYANGLGITAPGGEDGKVADSQLKRTIHPVSVRVGTEDAEILYCGSAPGIVEGVTQINFRLPRELPGNGGCCASIGLGVTEAVPQPVSLRFYFARNLVSLSAFGSLHPELG